MKASVRDSDVLNSMGPLELLSYIRASGWEQQQWVPEKFSVWTKRTDQGEFEVTLPLVKFRDYSIRVGELLSTLEVVEQRSQLEIVSDLNVATADVVRVSSDYPDAGQGSVPLEDAVLFVQKTRDMMLSAACTAIERRAYYPPRKFGQAMDYVKRVRMGQTERGSYVLTIVSPVPPAFPQDHRDVDEPYERQVTNMLSSAVAGVYHAADQALEADTLDPFREAVVNGVSANLCEALVGMSGVTGESRAVGLRFFWSRSRPIRNGGEARTTFPAHMMPVIREAGRVLREEAPIEEFDLRGLIIALDRPAGADIGTVTILGFIEDRPRRVRIELGVPDYELAARAHANRIPVMCSGVLVKEGRSFNLLRPHDFGLMPLEA